MTRTLAQKLVARAAGRPTVTPGDIVTCKGDLAMMHDPGRFVLPELGHRRPGMFVDLFELGRKYDA